MALVNPPPITPPRKWMSDPLLSNDVQELYWFLYQIWQRTGGGEDTVEEGSDTITIIENGWFDPIATPIQFQKSFEHSVQSTAYTTYTDEIIKLSQDVVVTLNPTPSDDERVYVKSTGKGYTVTSTKKIDGQVTIRLNRPYVGRWFSYSLELDTWSIL